MSFNILKPKLCVRFITAQQSRCVPVLRISNPSPGKSVSHLCRLILKNVKNSAVIGLHISVCAGPLNQQAVAGLSS